MIPLLLHRCEGGAAQLGAAEPGLPGPFGTGWPADEPEPDEDAAAGEEAE
ncbi:hypothetical protein [Streptantibioticus ferralitis]|uniref:Uncharacterized protein n=1 Tax=Streptantibioticus ferralitis TaxID=236510 RepID=A0ABT5Z8W8_9ACTN|nr:hypothetical protein [Streptantibioticus ferralitis]MDF2260254.1 hypothetical protein [Streptantibioticus ferralitis]